MATNLNGFSPTVGTKNGVSMSIYQLAVPIRVPTFGKEWRLPTAMFRKKSRFKNSRSGEMVTCQTKTVVTMVKKTIIEIHEQFFVTKVGRSGLCCGASFLQVPFNFVTGYGW